VVEFDNRGKRKVPHPYSRALPIHAKTGRERDRNRLLIDGVRDDEPMKNLQNAPRPGFDVHGRAAASLSGTRIAGTLIVLAHFAALLVHGAGHTHLDIKPNSWQTVFIAAVIFAGPFIAMVLLWTRLQQAALFLLGGTMAGALVFGIYYHFVAPGADNALGLTPGYWSTVFLVTSLLLAAIEALVCAWSAAILRRKTSAAA